MTRVLVTGSAGQLGRQVVLDARAAGHLVAGLGRQEPEPCDLTDERGVRALVTAFAPDLIVHAGAWTAVDACEADPARAHEVNALGTRHVVRAAAEVGAHVVYVSTDFVFDGTKTTPYTETDAVNPLSAYGRSKLAGEREMDPGHTIARTSWVCGAYGPNMVRTVLRLAAEHAELRFVHDQVGHPTFTADLSPALLHLGERRAAGTFHVTNQGAVSWYELAGEVLAAAGLDPDRVRPIASTDLEPARPAPRPANSVLDNAALRAAGFAELAHHRIPLQDLVDHLSRESGPA